MNIIKFDEIDSTQLEARRMIKHNKVLNGTIISAKNQTAGIGTHGRKWLSISGKNMTFSIILTPNFHIDRMKNFTLDIAKIIIDIFNEQYNIKLDIKEPNDIVYNKKKIGGILTESKVLGLNVKYIIVGIGINTNQTVFSDDIRDIATSIKNEFDIDVDNQKIIDTIGKRIVEYILNI